MLHAIIKRCCVVDRKARKGVEPGSFIDLLVKTTDRATGKPLSEESISQQVSNKTSMARNVNWPME